MFEILLGIGAVLSFLDVVFAPERDRIGSSVVFGICVLALIIMAVTGV